MVYNGTDKSGVFEYKLMNPLGTKAEGTVGAKKQTVVPDILTENHVGFEVKNTSSQEAEIGFQLTFKGFGK